MLRAVFAMDYDDALRSLRHQDATRLRCARAGADALGSAGLSEEAAAALRESMAAALAAAAAGEAPGGSAADEQYGREMWARCEALTSGGEAWLLPWTQECAHFGLVLRCSLQVVFPNTPPPVIEPGKGILQPVPSVKVCGSASACGLGFRVVGLDPGCPPQDDHAHGGKWVLTPGAWLVVGQPRNQGRSCARSILEPTRSSRLAGNFRSGERLTIVKRRRRRRNDISTLPAGLAGELAEQLRAILEPTRASRLAGDFRSGKRLAMRKVIAYIASHFRKDKIWLRRTRPDQRTYQARACAACAWAVAPATK